MNAKTWEDMSANTKLRSVLVQACSVFNLVEKLTQVCK